MPLVNINLITKNRERYLSEAIDSILMQSFQDWELIIIDDASEDKSFELIQEYLKKDSRIKCIKNEHSVGISKARNLALKNSKGEYVAVLDSDDVWIDKEKIKKQLELFGRNPDLMVIGGMAIVIDEYGKELRKYNIKSGILSKDTLLFGNPFVHSSVMFKRKEAVSFGGYDERLLIGEDYDLWLKFGNIGGLSNLSDSLINYRVHTDNVCKKNYWLGAWQTFKIIRDHKNDYPNYFGAFCLSSVKLVRAAGLDLISNINFIIDNLNKKFTGRYVYLSIFAAIVSMTFGLLTLYLPSNVTFRDPIYGYGSDSLIYWDAASNILKFGSSMHSPGMGNYAIGINTTYIYMTHRLPGYPLVLIAEKFLTGLSLPFKFSIFNIFFIFINCLISFLIYEKIFEKSNFKKPLYFLLIIFHPLLLYYSNGINSDFVSATLILTAIYLFLIKKKYLWLAAIMLAFSIFIRANVVFFVLPFVGLSLLYYFAKNKSVFIWLLVSVLMIVSTVLGWSYRNYKLSGYFNYTSFTGASLQQNYIRLLVWDVSALSRKVKLSKDILEKNKVINNINQNDYQLRSNPNAIDSNVLCSGLEEHDRQVFSSMFDNFKKETVKDQLTIARWNDPFYVEKYYNELKNKYNNTYKAVFQVDSEETRDSLRLVFNDKINALKVYLRMLVQISLNEYLIFEYIRFFPSLITYFVVALVLLIFFLVPAVLLFYTAFKFLLKKDFSEQSILIYSALFYILLNSVIWGGFARYLLPISYIMLINTIHFFSNFKIKHKI